MKLSDFISVKGSLEDSGSTEGGLKEKVNKLSDLEGL